ncbi:hypothetical protein [Halorubellus salinus]|uniref:hypothetical protein n=1 Tax=Halorubellus salinus TaxID=755309 RepID=UPI001D09952B|nr:hypothetical protein [Halorubellus salinus]
MRRASRRRVLVSTIPAVAATAGCLDSTVGDGRDDSTGTESTTIETTTDDAGNGDGDNDDADEGDGDASQYDVDGRSVELVSARTSRAIVTLLAGTHPSVSADADRQYVVVELDVSGEDAQAAAETACELRVDDDAIEPMSETVQPFTDGVHLAFALALDVDPGEVSLAWRGAAETLTFTLPASIAASLAAPPAFEVRSFDVPGTTDGDEVSVSFTVANVGESDGEFLAELGTRAVSDQGELRVEVPAGETKTVTRSVGLVPSAGEQTILLDWGSDSLERTVAAPTTTE